MDPDFFDEVYSISKRVDKPLRAAETFGPVPSSFGTVEHELHRIRRAPMNQHFSKRSVSELHPWIASRIEKLCVRFENAVKSGEILNLKYAYAALGLDVIYQYCFSRTLDSVLMPDFNMEYIDALEEGFHMTPVVSHSIYGSFGVWEPLITSYSSLNCTGLEFYYFHCQYVTVLLIS